MIRSLGDRIFQPCEVMLTLTNGLFEFTIAAADDSALPEVVLSFPADGANEYNATAGISLYFTEEVTAQDADEQQFATPK